MKNIIKIGFVIDTISTSTAGTQKQLLEIIRRLDKLKFEVHIVCLWESKWMQDNRLPCDVHIIGYRGFFKSNFVGVMQRFVRLIERMEFDILQTFFVESIFVAFLGRVFCQHKPVLLSSRRDIGLGSGDPWYHWLYRVALPLVNLKYEGIMANSQMVKRFVMLHEFVPGSKVKVIRNGVSLPDFTRINHEISAKNGEIIIGLVANLLPVKRVDIFLRALVLVRDSLPNLRFCAVICGDGPEKSNLLSLASQLDLDSNIRFVGKVEDVNNYVSCFHIGVLCSDREGLSNAILEYMAHALPIVATAVGGNSELVDERNGFCVAAGNPEALAQALIRLCNDGDLRVKLGKASFDKLKASYSWDKAIRELEEHYQDLVQRRYSQARFFNLGSGI